VDGDPDFVFGFDGAIFESVGLAIVQPMIGFANKGFKVVDFEIAFFDNIIQSG
jgi:hypothetical protein